MVARRWFTALIAAALALTLAAARPQERRTLEQAYANDFLVGAALNAWLIGGRDTLGAALVKAQFNTITPENCLKWERVHPEPERYDFDIPDQYVAFGERNGMVVIGHTLVWHNQTPAWVFRDGEGKPASRDTLLARMRDHIHTVVGRYRGRIRGWDVVNEAIDEDGSMRQSPWFRILGEDYVAQAFRFAHEADPDAELYYNDYELEETPAKRAGVLRLVTRLKEEGVPITGVGLQDHIRLDTPTLAQMDTTIAAFAALGLTVQITELDVDVLPRATPEQEAQIRDGAEVPDSLNPYRSGLPDSVQQALTNRYAEVFAIYRKHRDVIRRVTFWGVTDRWSWKNNWPIRGRTNYPLLWDRAGNPKPAFDAVIRAAGETAIP